MPSVVIGFVSGGQRLYSGNPYSGRQAPVGTVKALREYLGNLHRPRRRPVLNGNGRH
jgi:hypothetical protein